ncbi:MAG: SPOR domain-containing protein [Bacteroidetes bacterium]|nr:SPOR domain-containing protein [Bacteroidota bacterium]
MNRPVVILVVLFISAGWQKGFTQEVRKDSGTVTIYQDNMVDELVQKQIKLNEAGNNLEGYRIQIFSDSGNNSKTKAQSAMDEFLAKYPEIKAYLVFKSPNYKVKIGDFRSKLDAIRCLNQITAEFPNAFIISDLINLPQVEP